MTFALLYPLINITDQSLSRFYPFDSPSCESIKNKKSTKVEFFYFSAVPRGIPPRPRFRSDFVALGSAECSLRSHSSTLDFTFRRPKRLKDCLVSTRSIPLVANLSKIKNPQKWNFFIFQQSLGESNPCYQDENLVS